MTEPWPLMKLGRMARTVSGTGFPHDYQGREKGEYPFFKVSDFNLPGNEVELKSCTNWIDRPDLQVLGGRLVPAGSILFPKVGAAMLGNARRITTEPSVFDNNVMALIPIESEPKFLFYLMRSLDLGELGNPGPVPSIGEGTIKDIRLRIPSRAGQRAIVEFLDRETARIDGLLDAKRKLLGTISERRASTVLHGVCGLLDYEGPTHDAGLPWAPRVRDPWPGVKLNLVARLGTGHTPSRSRKELWENPTVPWVTTGEIQQVRDDRREVITETREKVSELGLANSSAELHPAGTVVLCRTASAGYSAIMGSAMATSQDFVTWTCSPALEPRYLLMCLRAMRPDLLGRLAYGSTHKTIYWPDVLSLKIPLPTTEEQVQALGAIDTRLADLDDLSDLVTSQVPLLVERRKALIGAAVTGQLPIQEAA